MNIQLIQYIQFLFSGKHIQYFRDTICVSLYAHRYLYFNDNGNGKINGSLTVTLTFK